MDSTLEEIKKQINTMDNTLKEIAGKKKEESLKSGRNEKKKIKKYSRESDKYWR